MEPENKNASLNGVYIWIAVLFAITSIIFGFVVFELYSRCKRLSNEISDVNSLIASDDSCRRQFGQMQIPDLVDYLRYVYRISPNFDDRMLDSIVNREKMKWFQILLRSSDKELAKVLETIRKTGLINMVTARPMPF
jgi:hypothetical protein